MLATASAPAGTAIIHHRTVTLRDLPPVTDISFSGLPGWAPVSTSIIVAGLKLDRGTWHTWKNRGILPTPLPPVWFKRTAGAPNVYRVDTVLAWIAARRGETYGLTESWGASLVPLGYDPAAMSEAEIRSAAVMYARAAGREVEGVTLTEAGFRAYLASLTEA